MKMNLFRIMPLLGAVLLVASGCEQETPDYIEKSIPVMGYDLNEIEPAKCRFYKDIDALPYIDINSYYKYLLDKEVTITHVEGNKYLIKTFTGEATIDVEEDVLYSEDYNQFINTTIYRSGDSRNVYFDGAPYIRTSEAKSEEEVTPKTIDFKKYKIDFKYDDNKIWAPLITLSDMFKGVTMIQTFYNGEKIYLIDSNHAPDGTPVFSNNDYISPAINTFFKDGKRNPLLAERSYLEMCFNIDHYYGFPGRSPLDDLIKEHGLDYALQNYSDSSRLTRQYLLSDKLSEYFAGMGYLANLLDDGGHTVMDYGTYLASYSPEIHNTELYNEIIEATNNGGYEPIPTTGTTLQELNDMKNIRKGMDANKHFRSEGDTFIYTFDGFDINYEAWDDFYANKTSEYPNDTIGNFHKVIEMAKEDENIKNFVLDISINGGGYGDVVMYLLKAITNKSTMYFHDYIDERNVEQTYLCDINLDGEFNALDNEPLADFNYGIIVSNISFSCGNLLPALLKEEGIPLLGVKTGGGACAVLDSCSMEGIYYRSSSFVHFTDSEYESIDKGVEVDYDLFNATTLPSYNNLYDIELISEKMNLHYSK